MLFPLWDVHYKIKNIHQKPIQESYVGCLSGGRFIVYESEVAVSSVFLRLLADSSLSSWLLNPFTASGPKIDTCLLVIWRPALSFGPQCRSGLGRKRATFLACTLFTDAARAKFAWKEKWKLMVSSSRKLIWLAAQVFSKKLNNFVEQNRDTDRCVIVIKFIARSQKAPAEQVP